MKKKQTTEERIAEDYDMYTGNRTRERACADPWLVKRIRRALAAERRRCIKRIRAEADEYAAFALDGTESEAAVVLRNVANKIEDSR